MKIILFIFSFLIIFSGCAEKDVQTLRKECQQEGKKFTTKKVFNFRTGEYEIRHECK
jgi:hypothetical protein